MGRVLRRPSTDRADDRDTPNVVQRLPFRFPGVHGQHFHERGERLVEPQAVPPTHRHQIAEPHMGVFMGDHVGDALALGVSGRRLVHEQGGLAEGDGAEVLHRPGREIGDGDEVELVAGIFATVILLIKAQREGADGLAERRQLLLARNAPDAQRRLADHRRRRRLQLADDISHQIGRHRNRVGEADDLLAVLDALLGDGRVGDDLQFRRNNQRGGEDGLEGGFVPAGEGAAGVGRLELRGRESVRLAGLILVRTAVEAAQLVVKHAA